MSQSDLNEFLSVQCSEHIEVIQLSRKGLLVPLQELVRASVVALRQGRKLIFFGNGGSAADAQHIATEFTVRFKSDRRALAALALTTDCSALTAIGNDQGFEYLFSRQVEALCEVGDVVVGISTSGNSLNVINGIEAARVKGAVTAAFGGGTGGRMREIVDHPITVPSQVTARIQEVHILLGHLLCAAVERELQLS